MGRKPFWDNLANVDELCFFLLPGGKIPRGVKLTPSTFAARITAVPLHLVKTPRDHGQWPEKCLNQRETPLIKN